MKHNSVKQKLSVFPVSFFSMEGSIGLDCVVRMLDLNTCCLGLERCSGVKNACNSCKESWLQFLTPTGWLATIYTPVSGNTMPSSGSGGHQACARCAYIQVGKHSCIQTKTEIFTNIKTFLSELLVCLKWSPAPFALRLGWASQLYLKCPCGGLNRNVLIDSWI